MRMNIKAEEQVRLKTCTKLDPPVDGRDLTSPMKPNRRRLGETRLEAPLGGMGWGSSRKLIVVIISYLPLRSR
jgi:hypothetical protein